MPNEIKLKNALSTALITNKYRKTTIIIPLIFLILTIIFEITPYPEQMKNVIILLLVWLFSAFVFGFLLKKQKSAIAVNNLYLGYNLTGDFLWMTLITYNAGGGEWIAAMFYIFPIVYTNIVVSEKRGMITSAIACVYYTALVLLQYFNLIPFKPFFPLGVKLYQNPKYLLFLIPFVWYAFYFIGRVPSIFTQILKNRTLELEKAKEGLERSKAVLEVRVEARTKELEEFNRNLEGEVGQRTKELQEKVKELEKFQRFTVDRELKMTELKEQIKKLGKRVKTE